MAEKPKKILHDHKKKGRKLVPPFVHSMGNITPVRWLDNLLPEIFWLGLLAKQYGEKDAADLALKLSTVTNEIIQPEMAYSFNFISEYSLVTTTHSLKILEKVGKEKSELILNGLWPLVFFYPMCPLKVLFPETWNEGINKNSSLDLLKEVAELLSDRREKFATFVQTTSYYLGIMSGKVRIAAGLPSADFDLNEIEHYPDTEQSRKIASSVRAHMNGLGGIVLDNQSHKDWAKYFWNRGFEISPCEPWDDES